MLDCPCAHLNQTTRNSLLRGGTGQHEPLKTDTETCAASRARVMTTVTQKNKGTQPPTDKMPLAPLGKKFLQLHDKRSKSASALVTEGGKRLVIHRRPIWREIFRHRPAFSRRLSSGQVSVSDSRCTKSNLAPHPLSQ